MNEREVLMATGAARIERGAAVLEGACPGGAGKRHDGRCGKPHPSGTAWTDKSGKVLQPSEDGREQGKFVGEIHYWFADADGYLAGDYDGYGELDPAELLAGRIPAGVRILDKATNAEPPRRPPTPEQIAVEQKRERLDALRAKGWANLTAAEKSEAQALGFELGEYVPA